MRDAGAGSVVSGWCLGQSPDSALCREYQGHNVPGSRGADCLPPWMTRLGARQGHWMGPKRLDLARQPARTQISRLYHRAKVVGHHRDRLPSDVRPQPTPVREDFTTPATWRTLAPRSKHHRETAVPIQTIETNSENAHGEVQGQRRHRHRGVKQGLVASNIRLPLHHRTKIRNHNRPQIGTKNTLMPAQPSRRDQARTEPPRHAASPSMIPLVLSPVRNPKSNGPKTLNQRETATS